jgi:hypothetical protein
MKATTTAALATTLLAATASMVVAGTAFAEGFADEATIEASQNAADIIASQRDDESSLERFENVARAARPQPPVIIKPPVDPWTTCANYAQLQAALKGTADFYATGVNLQCTWNNSDVQPSVTVKNQTQVYFAPGSTIFYCTKGGAVGKQDLWGDSLAAGTSKNYFVPFGSGNTCLAKGVYYVSKNPPK